MILRDFSCPACSLTFEGYGSIDDTPPCPECAAPSSFVFSPVLGRAQFVTVERGKVAPPPKPWALDTTRYGDGEQTYHEFKETRDQIQQDLRRAEIKRRVG